MNRICNVPLAQKSAQDLLAIEYAQASDVLKALWKRVEADRLARVCVLQHRRNIGALKK